MTELRFLPFWSMYTVIVAAVVLVACMSLRALSEGRAVKRFRQIILTLLCSGVIILLIWVALNPTAMRALSIPEKPALIVLIDTSRSMSVEDVDKQSRLGAALDAIKQSLSYLEEKFDLDTRTFDHDLRVADLPSLSADAAVGGASDIGSAIAEAVDDLSAKPDQAGILLTSDGRATHQGAADSARLALAHSVPLWAWCLGGIVPRRDLRIDVASSEVLAFAEDEVELTATLHQMGYEDRSFDVELVTKGQVIHRVEAVPESKYGEGSNTAIIRLKVRAPIQGEQQYVFRVVEDEDEADRQNNQRSLFLRVVGGRARVLVAEGQPHWDTTFLVQSLKRNPRIDLTAIYRLSARRQFAVVSADGHQQHKAKDLFPRTADAFEAFDVIILGRGCEALFDESTEEHLTNFVAEHGGGLILSRGKSYGGRFAPLAKLEPVVWGTGEVEGVRLVPIDIGNESPIWELSDSGELDALIDRLPRFDQITDTVGVKPLAVVMAHGESMSQAVDATSAPIVMAYHQYGQGRIVTLNAGGLWRWSFRERGEAKDEFVYDRFWGSLLRWLLSTSDFLAGQNVALRSDRRLYTAEQPMKFLIRTRGLDQEAYRPQLTIHGSEMVTQIDPQRLPSGSFLAEAGPFPAGTYNVILSNNLGQPPQLSTTVQVVYTSIENRNLSSDSAMMRQLAEISDGQVIEANDLTHLDKIYRQWQMQHQLTGQQMTLWDRWGLIFAVLVLLGLEWFIRRREGLL